MPLYRETLTERADKFRRLYSRKLKRRNRRAPLFQIRRIEWFQIFRQEHAVSADEFAIKPDFAAAPFGPLNQHHVPMHRRAISVVALLVGLTGREVQRAGDFFIEQNIAHRTEDVGIEAEREFADVTRAWVRIQNFIEALRVVRRCVDNFAVFEFEADVFEFGAGIERGRVELNYAIDRILHRAGKDLAVGNIAIAFAHLGADAFDAEFQIGAG